MLLLTKSKYMLGLQCPKLLWIATNAKEEMPQIDSSTEYTFKQGIRVGELAKLRFERGRDITTDGFLENLQETQDQLKNRVVLFEAGFRSELQKGEVFSRVDIIVPVENDKWDIIEVKSSTSVKEEHIDDVSFQKFCLESTGLKIRNCFLMHINNQYVKDGEIDIKELFVISDITELVNEKIESVDNRINEMFDILNIAKEYEYVIGTHCNKPYECVLKSKCWSFLPENNVFDLYRGGKKSFELLENGILQLSDIPEGTKLTKVQKIQRNCSVSDSIHINHEKIKAFIDELNYPLYFLDFETINPAIPKFDGTKPYQKIPFQFSLHIQRDAVSEPEHYSFLAQGTYDPRQEFMQLLYDSLGDNGDIIVYNASFENGILRECSDAYPEYNSWYEDNIQPRIKDLLIPFRNFDYYNPVQRGSASIKAVLPALSELSYSDMAISGGSDASHEFERVTYDSDVSSDERDEVREALLEYCKLDTEAEVIIIEKLKEIIEK